MTRRKPSVAGSPDVGHIFKMMRSHPAKGRGQRSPLYLWLRRHHARLVEEFAVQTPSWPGLAAALGKSGVLDGNGNPPSAETARSVWYRVRRDVAVKRATASLPDRSIAVATPAPSEAVQLNGDSDGDAGAVGSPKRFGTVKLRSPASETTAPSTAPLPNEGSPTVDADAVLAKFMPSAGKRGSHD